MERTSTDGGATGVGVVAGEGEGACTELGQGRPREQPPIGRRIAAIKGQWATADIRDQGSRRTTSTDLERAGTDRGVAGVSVVATEDESATLTFSEGTRA